RRMGGREPRGLDVDPNNTYTAAAAACDFVIERFATNASSQQPPNAEQPETPAEASRKPRVFNLATESIDDMLHGLVDWVSNANEPCDAVIVGPPSSKFATEERQRTA